MKKGGCRTIIVSERTRSSLKSMNIENEGDRTVNVSNASKFESFLPNQEQRLKGVLQYLEKCRDAVRENDTNVVILHSSGTTG